MVDPTFYLRNSVRIPSACRERFAPLERPALASWRAAGVTLAGVSDLVPGYAIANPKPAEVMVIATVAGRGWAVTPKQTHALTPGSLFVGAPGQPVGWGIVGSAWRIAWWYLRPLPRWAAWCGVDARLRSCAEASILAALCDDLLERASSEDATARRLTTLAADLALAHLDQLAAPTNSVRKGEEDDAFTALWRTVAGSLHEDWSAPTLAARLGISVSSLQRLSRQRLGHGPHSELVRLRLAHARELVERTRYPLRVIAGLAGYADPFTFSSAFQRWAGVRPSALRPQNDSNENNS